MSATKFATPRIIRTPAARPSPDTPDTTANVVTVPSMAPKMKSLRSPWDGAASSLALMASRERGGFRFGGGTVRWLSHFHPPSSRGTLSYHAVLDGG